MHGIKPLFFSVSIVSLDGIVPYYFLVFLLDVHNLENSIALLLFLACTFICIFLTLIGMGFLGEYNKFVLLFTLCCYCLRVVAGSVRVLIVSRLRQGIVIGQAWLSTQIYIHRTTSSGELDAREYGPQTKERADTSRGQKRQNPCPSSLRASDMFVRVQHLISAHDNKLKSGTLLAFFGLY